MSRVPIISLVLSSLLFAQLSGGCAHCRSAESADEQTTLNDSDLEALLASNEDEGRTIIESDGMAYFIRASGEHRELLPHAGLYRAYRKMGQGGGSSAHPSIRCGAVKAWLDHNRPGSVRWNRVCLWYFDNCIDD